MSRNAWTGIGLTTAAVVATVWLAATNQLVLYIHPRYVVFTVVMAVFAAGFLGAAIAVRPTVHDQAEHDEGDDSDDDHDRGSRRQSAREARITARRRVLTVVGGATVVVVSAALLVLPPTTLTSATANQRDISASTVGANTKTLASATRASSGAFSAFTVSDWSALLRQSSDPAFYANKPVDVVGFVTADRNDPDNVFFVTRFVITCCAVDAQPVAVPVYLPDWSSRFRENAWVRVVGGLVSNPSAKSLPPLAVVPSGVAGVAKPASPYLF